MKTSVIRMGYERGGQGQILSSTSSAHVDGMTLDKALKLLWFSLSCFVELEHLSGSDILRIQDPERNLRMVSGTWVVLRIRK